MQKVLFAPHAVRRGASRILSVATAGLHTDQLKDTDHVRYPRVDYVELQDLLEVETIDYSAYNSHSFGRLFHRLETQLRSDIYIAMLGWLKSHSHPLVFTWSERAGIPLAAYRRFARGNNRFVTMFHCWSRRQESVITKLNLLSTMDQIIVHCQSMKENLVGLGAPERRVKLVHYSIDQQFFSPLSHVEQRSNLIVSVGEARSRHYPMLFQAVDGLPVNVTVAGFGHWYAREKQSFPNDDIPDNVTMSTHLTQLELRKLYASSQFVVLPIQDLVYSAGATASLEAGSMARAVVAFRSRGIADYIIDGETGILVEPSNASAMRDAIRYLLANPRAAKRMGENARQRVLEEFNVESYVSNIADVLVGNERAEERSVARSGLPVSV